MKPAHFAYHRPASLDEALALLERYGSDGRILAGTPGAVLNAVDDALAPFGAGAAAQPITPEVVLKALGAL